MTTLQSNILENHTPTGREEAWRFTPLKRLGGMHDGSATAIERNSLAVKGSLPTGVTFSHQEIEAVTQTDDAIVNRVRQFTNKAAVLAIAPNAEIAEPIIEPEEEDWGASESKALVERSQGRADESLPTFSGR
jgi:Fe-S cluster assembly protein SufD